MVALLRHRRHDPRELGIVQPVLRKLSLVDEVIPALRAGESSLTDNEPTSGSTLPASWLEELIELLSILNSLQRRPPPSDRSANFQAPHIATSPLLASRPE